MPPIYVPPSGAVKPKKPKVAVKAKPKVVAKKKAAAAAPAQSQFQKLLASLVSTKQAPYEAPDIPEYGIEQPATQSAAALQAAARSYVDAVYAPQRQLAQQLIAEEAGRSAARANQMRDVYTSLGQFVQQAPAQVQGVYQSAARDMNSFSQGHADAMAMTGQQAAGSQNAALSYLNAPQGQMATGDFGASAKFGDYASQGTQALESAGAGWGAYTAQLPGIYARMGEMDIQQMMGESAAKESELRRSLLELSSKEAGDILDYLKEQQTAQTTGLSEYQKGLSEYNRWAYEQKGKAREAYGETESERKKTLLEVLKFGSEQQGKAAEREQKRLEGARKHGEFLLKLDVDVQKANQLTRIANRKQTTAEDKVKLTRRSVRLAERHEDNQVAQNRVVNAQDNKKFYLSQIRSLNSTGSVMYEFDPKYGYRIMRDAKGAPILTERARSNMAVLAVTKRALGVKEFTAKVSAKATFRKLDQVDREITRKMGVLAETIRNNDAKAADRTATLEEKAQARADNKAYRAQLIGLRAESNKINKWKVGAAIREKRGTARAGQVKTRNTTMAGVATKITSDITTRNFPGGFRQAYDYYLNAHGETAKRFKATAQLDRIIRRAWRTRKAGKKKSTSGGGLIDLAKSLGAQAPPPK